MKEIRCECGAKMKGMTENHSKSILEAHLAGKKHQEMMEIKKYFEDKNNN